MALRVGGRRAARWIGDFHVDRTRGGIPAVASRCGRARAACSSRAPTATMKHVFAALSQGSGRRVAPTRVAGRATTPLFSIPTARGPDHRPERLGPPAYWDGTFLDYRGAWRPILTWYLVHRRPSTHPAPLRLPRWSTPPARCSFGFPASPSRAGRRPHCADGYTSVRFQSDFPRRCPAHSAGAAPKDRQRRRPSKVGNADGRRAHSARARGQRRHGQPCGSHSSWGASTSADELPITASTRPQQTPATELDVDH
jgi:hypothetical protein